MGQVFVQSLEQIYDLSGGGMALKMAKSFPIVH